MWATGSKQSLNRLGFRAPKFSIATVDIETFGLPNFNESVHPALISDLSKFTSQSACAWNYGIAKYDAYIVVSPEYHGAIPGILKNAPDFHYHAWAGKPAMIVTYGIMGGTSASEGLREVLVTGFRMKVSSIVPRLEISGRDPTKSNLKLPWRITGHEVDRSTWEYSTPPPRLLPLPV
jgi:NAD(P)H-dependent FMN reductase